MERQGQRSSLLAHHTTKPGPELSWLPCSDGKYVWTGYDHAGSSREGLYTKTCHASLPTVLAQHCPNASVSPPCKQTLAPSYLFTSHQTHSFFSKECSYRRSSVTIYHIQNTETKNSQDGKGFALAKEISVFFMSSVNLILPFPPQKYIFKGQLVYLLSLELLSAINDSKSKLFFAKWN